MSDEPLSAHLLFPDSQDAAQIELPVDTAEEEQVETVQDAEPQEEQKEVDSNGVNLDAAEPELPGSNDSRVLQLEADLAEVRNAKEVLEGQYRSLVNKLTTMRNTLGEKLKQDADELDRRATEISELRTANSDLAFSLETLKSEFESSNADNSNLSDELSVLKSRVSETTNESELALQEANEDIERLRSEVESLSVSSDRERMHREKAEQTSLALQRELQILEDDYDTLTSDCNTHKTSATNLHLVLEEFQATKEKELEAATKDLRQQLQGSVRMLSEFKERAAKAESDLSRQQIDAQKAATLEKETKEKSVLIGRLRHDNVVLGEQLTEAMKRLRTTSSDTLVDRRLISNVLISFLCTPRADPKRFEMLQLLGSVLSWTDDERERAGLQRSSGSSSNKNLSAPSVLPRRRGHTRNQATQSGMVLDENESFTNLWVEYLLREATSQGGSTAASTASLGASPLASPNPNGPLSPLGSPPTSPTFSSFSAHSRYPMPPRQRTLSPTASFSSLASLTPSSHGQLRPKSRSDSTSTSTTRPPSVLSSFENNGSTAPSSLAPSQDKVAADG